MFDCLRSIALNSLSKLFQLKIIFLDNELQEFMESHEDGATFYQREDDITVIVTRTNRGKPAILCNGIKYTLMSENKQRVLWRCSTMMNNLRKCPARIAQTKTNPPLFSITRGNHIHAEMKRGRYNVRVRDPVDPEVILIKPDLD